MCAATLRPSPPSFLPRRPTTVPIIRVCARRRRHPRLGPGRCAARARFTRELENRVERVRTSSFYHARVLASFCLSKTRAHKKYGEPKTVWLAKASGAAALMLTYPCDLCACLCGIWFFFTVCECDSHFAMNTGGIQVYYMPYTISIYGMLERKWECHLIWS